MRLEVKIVNNPHGVNVRQGPSASTSKISWLAYGATAIVITKQGDWYQLNVGGWITAQSQYVKVVKDLENKKSETTPAASVPTSNPNTNVSSNPAKDTFIKSLKQDSGGLVFKDLKKPAQKPTAENDYEPTVYSPQSGLQTFEGVVPWDNEYIANNMQAVRRNLNMVRDVGFSNIKHELYTKFNRFKIAYPQIYAGKTFSHVFFTRPDLNLLSGGEQERALGASGSINEAKLNNEFDKDPVFYYLFNNQRQLLMSLTKHLTESHDFNVYLSNSAESFEVPDEFIDTQEHGETLTGYKMQYGKHNIKSNTAGTFTVAYSDDADANIYKMHKAWIEYISKVYRGEATPKRDYIKKRILDYACSVYYFIVGPDGETILFWTKYFGVFPTNTPASAYSWAKSANVRIPQLSINYAYAFKEDFDPLSLAEFNMNSSMDLNYVKTFEPALASTGKTFTGAPFIETYKDKATNEYSYKLRFRKDYREGR